MLGVSISGIATDPESTGFGVGFKEILTLLFFGALYVVYGSVQTLIVGYFTVIFLSLVDLSFGKILQPLHFGALSVGLSVIPISYFGMLLHAFSTYPESNFYIYSYYISTIFVGCVCGVWGAETRISQHESPTKISLQFNTRQILALTGWLTLLMAVSFADTGFLVFLLIAALIFFLTAAIVLFVYAQVILRLSDVLKGQAK